MRTNRHSRTGALVSRLPARGCRSCGERLHDSGWFDRKVLEAFRGTSDATNVTFLPVYWTGFLHGRGLLAFESK